MGEEFEVEVKVKEAIGYIPTRRPIVLLHEVTYVPASPEAVKIWENRKKQIELKKQI